jgi:hypothetical protein
VRFGEKPIIAQLLLMNLGPAANQPEHPPREITVEYPKILYPDLASSC